MATFKVEYTEQEIIQILGGVVREKYNLNPRQQIVVTWIGPTPAGVSITSQSLTRNSASNPFDLEDD